MKVAEAAGLALAKLGVTHVFGLVGSGNFLITNALVNGGSQFVGARHETAAVCMADGYARVTGRVGVASVHQGPGFTNAVTGLTESAKANTPLVLIAADTPASWQDSNFKIDQVAVASAVGASVEQVHSAETALADVTRAFDRASRRGGAVVLLLPLDVQEDETDWPGAFTPLVDRDLIEPSPEAVERIADAAAAAERPIIIAGRGAVVSDAEAEIQRLAELIGALVLTSINGHGLFTGDPFTLGISGGFSTPIARDLSRDADLVLAFGASLNRWTTLRGTMFEDDAHTIQVDVNHRAHGMHLPLDLAVLGDAGVTARNVADILEARGVRSSGYRNDKIARLIAKGGFADIPFDDMSTTDTIDPRSFTMALNHLLPRDRVIVVDSGHFSGWPVMYLSVAGPDSFIFNQAFQSVGVGLGAAIGASFGRPDRVVVAASGDGGFYMSLSDLETAVRHHLPILVLVYNDNAYGAEVHHFASDGHDLSTVVFPDTDIAAVGLGLGASSATIRTIDDLSSLEKWLDTPDGPMVVDVKVERSVVGRWLPEAFAT